MDRKEFVLKSDYIELNKLLKLLRIAQSGAHAKLMIEQREVRVNNTIESRKRAKLKQGDIVRVKESEITIIKE